MKIFFVVIVALLMVAVFAKPDKVKCRGKKIGHAKDKGKSGFEDCDSTVKIGDLTIQEKLCNLDPDDVTWDDIKGVYPNLFKNSTELGLEDSARIDCVEVPGTTDPRTGETVSGYCIWNTRQQAKFGCKGDSDLSCVTCQHTVHPLGAMKSTTSASHTMYPVALGKSRQYIRIGTCGEKNNCYADCHPIYRDIQVLVSSEPIEAPWQFLEIPHWWEKIKFPSHCICAF